MKIDLKPIKEKRYYKNEIILYEGKINFVYYVMICYSPNNQIYKLYEEEHGGSTFFVFQNSNWDIFYELVLKHLDSVIENGLYDSDDF